MKFIKIEDFKIISDYRKVFFVKQFDSQLNKYVEELSKILSLQYGLKFNYIFKEEIHKLKLEKNKDINIVTVDPRIYKEFSGNSNFNCILFIVSVEENFSNLKNLSRYIFSNKINKKKNLIFKLSYFKKFLFENYPKKKILGILNNLLSFINLNIKKRYLYKKFWIPILVINDIAYRGNYIGLGKYNYVYNKNDQYLKKYQFIVDKLEDEESKEIFKITNFSKPKYIWNHYFKSLFSYPHYTEFLPKNEKSVILNLGVANGFEIPYFLTQNVSKIINVDPTGDELLHSYVKIFCELNNEKVIFNRKYLYDDKRVYLKSKEGKTSVIEIIKEYKLKSLDYIKSDIEGSEVHLLKELEIVVEKFRPILALSIYHRHPIEEQIIEIPYFLISKLKDYKFYIRHYTYNKWDTIIYCCPC